MLQLYNTLTRKKEPFKEIKKGHVSMYSCGPTVYDYAHIGNFRAYISSDILKRYLTYKGYSVKHVMNLTDVDDKTIKNSREQRVKLDDYTAKYKKAFFEDVDCMNIIRADVYPEATRTINRMVEIVKMLMDKEFAYKGDDDSIYFNVKKFKDYGKLSKIKLDELQEGARVKNDEYEKESASDFALWKAWDKNDGDVFWNTDIGKGRPGWHIECSAMSTKELGNHFDIHTGGVDLIFPHHENEIAQSECATGEKFVNYWVHNEWLLVDSKKMSKSLGNFYTIRDLLKKGYSAKAIRYVLMATHYKVQLNFTEDGLKAAESTIKRFREFMERLEDVKETNDNEEINKLIEKVKSDFEEKMDDDLNISEAMASIFDFMKDINKLIDSNNISKKNANDVLKAMKGFDKVLGILKFEKEKIPDNIVTLVKKREIAREKKDWELSDKLRDEIKKKGYTLDDSKDGTKVKKSS